MTFFHARPTWSFLLLFHPCTPKGKINNPILTSIVTSINISLILTITNCIMDNQLWDNFPWESELVYFPWTHNSYSQCYVCIPGTDAFESH